MTSVTIDDISFIKVKHDVQGEYFINAEQVEEMNITSLKFVECEKEGETDSSLAITAKGMR